MRSTGFALRTVSIVTFVVFSGLCSASADSWASTLTVNSTADSDDGSCDSTSSGDCTLREAMSAASSGDTINFSFTGNSEPRTIVVGSTLPDVDAAFTIDGFDCSGCGPVSENTVGASPALGLDSVLGVTLVASSSSVSPILYMTHDGTVRGLNIQGSGGSGILLDQADNAVIKTRGPSNGLNVARLATKKSFSSASKSKVRARSFPPMYEV